MVNKNIWINVCDRVPDKKGEYFVATILDLNCRVAVESLPENSCCCTIWYFDGKQFPVHITHWLEQEYKK